MVSKKLITGRSDYYTRDCLIQRQFYKFYTPFDNAQIITQRAKVRYGITRIAVSPASRHTRRSGNANAMHPAVGP
jgi:hypothetical protein